MAVMAVNATRMELLRLKERLTLARRGHKLLKDKQDELMNQLSGLIEKIKELREQTDKSLEEVYRNFLVARMYTDIQVLEQALSLPSKIITLQIRQKQIMNVRIPVLELKSDGSPYCYGLSYTPGDLDISLAKLEKALSSIIELAQTEKSIHLLADEIKRTKRRVNALEHILIPNLQDTIRYIEMKLEEEERETFTRLMKIKEMFGTE